jgi:hypothetical protein
VRYSYSGACNEVDRREINQTVDNENFSYNITGLRGYLNYSITLTAINDTGISPPNIEFVVTNFTGMTSEYRVHYELYNNIIFCSSIRDFTKI